MYLIYKKLILTEQKKEEEKIMLNSPYHQKLFQCMLKTLEHSSQSFLYIDKNETTPFYANLQASKHFADESGVIDLDVVFYNEDTPEFLRATIKEQLEVADYVMLHDISVTNQKKETQFCDVQIGYADEEKNSLFIEIFCI